MRVVAFALAFAMTACPPSPAPPSPDASDAAPKPGPSSASVAACANLDALGCDEGADAHCAIAFDKLVANPQVARVDLPCLTAARSKDAVRACGLVTCP